MARQRARAPERGRAATSRSASCRATERRRRRSPTTPATPIERVLSRDLPLPRARAEVVEEFERRYVQRVLDLHGGNVSRAAAASGIALRYFQLLKAKRGK